MKMSGLLKSVKGMKGSESPAVSNSKRDRNAVDNWFHDRFEWMQVQRNLLFLILLGCVFTICLLTFGISFIKSTKAIEPFVIEIEAKTGVPTVVDPLTSKAYSGMETIRRYFIWRYISMREEYDQGTFRINYQNVRYLSTDAVYWLFSRMYGQGNPESIVNKTPNATRTIELKSMIFPDDSTAQVRIRVTVRAPGGMENVLDKIVYLQFQFSNLELNDQQRLVNPLGFQVTNYKIENERG
jgi:type IV secretion system protein VirB8